MGAPFLFCVQNLQRKLHGEDGFLTRTRKPQGANPLKKWGAAITISGNIKRKGSE